MLKEALMHDGATVTTCESAIEALDAFRHVVPEALVSDIAMLRENGYWLIEQVRTLPPERGGRIPAVAITAYGTLFDRRRALEAGFDAYLQKPFDPWELCRVVAAITANA